MSQELQACPLCVSTSFEQLYLTRDRHYGIAGTYRIVRCNSCSLMFLNPMYSDAELAKLYPDDYYAYQDRSMSTRWKELLKAALGYRISTKDPRFASPGTMLDLGCGSGWFLAAMRDRGWETYGVEINQAAAKLGQETHGLQIFSGSLQEARFPSDFFDYIRSNHSFEHISCPNETLKEICRILKPGGKVLIGVPNVEGLNARLFKQYWWYLGAPVHPFNYSVRTLSEMLAKHGFAIVAATYNSDYSGILGSSQIWRNRNNQMKSSEGWLINNPALRLTCHWAAKFLDLFHLGDAIEITATKAAGIA